jgi:hypothetical protein
MDMMPAPTWLLYVTPLLVAVQFAWYIGRSVLLIRIWRKVRHLTLLDPQDRDAFENR